MSIRNGMIIGWVGVDKYDIMLYISSLLSNARKNKVLLIDNSETEALTYCIPIPADMSPEHKKISVSESMDFVKRRMVDEYLTEYDYILIDFGFELAHKDISKCSKLFIVADKQLNNIERLCRLRAGSGEIFAIFKEVHRTEDLETLKIYLVNKFPVKDYFTLDFTEYDKERMVAIQYNYKIAKRMSGEYRRLIERIMQEILLYDKQEFGLAYKNFKRGA